MVKSAVALGERWGVAESLIGVLVLGPLTSIPNAQTAIRLGLRSRGSALVSETFASNTINLVGGLLVPALFVEVVSQSRTEKLGLLWLGAMTLLCLIGLWPRRGMRRQGGTVLVAMYVAFVAFQLSA
jgi:Ca2+/Na+ antiporter